MNADESYNIEWLKRKLEETDSLKYLYFWGHKPNNDGKITSSCLSQWWKCKFEHEGLVYLSTEHWMMYHKALLFNNQEIAKQVLSSLTPGEAKALGRKVTNFDNEVWKAHRMQIVVKGNLLKFSQNNDLKTYLINTKERILVEASPVDEIWGVGLSKDSNKIQDPSTWRGLNLLGFALMEVRDLLTDKN